MAEVANSKLLNTQAGIPQKDACVVIVRTEWNAQVVDELEKGCLKKLQEAGITNTIVLTVPGAFEIPFAVKRYWEQYKYRDDRPQAFIALGCVLRGDTPHFEYVCRGVTDGVMELNMSLPVPVVFGVLTVDTQQQADERIGGRHGHKGEEAAITAIKMISFVHSLKK